MTSQERFLKQSYNAIRRTGEKPIRAKYDDAGNCKTCGECGRCPSYHTAKEIDAKQTFLPAVEPIICAGSEPLESPFALTGGAMLSNILVQSKLF